MCKAIRDGGNRCPKHRHDSIALVQLASELSGMTKAQTEDMFVQLRREGRNPEAVSQKEWDAALTKIDEAIEASDSSDKEALKARMVKARTHGRIPSRATVYAMGLLIDRSKERGQNLENRLKELADNSGFTTQEVKEKFAAEYAAVDRSRGAAVPEEYNQSSVRYATLANLPHDRSTVTALAKVKAAIKPGPRRVTRAPLPHRSSFIHEAGYHDGRLEMTFKANPTTVYAYRNVPASVWDRMQEGSAGSIFSREVRGNSEYLYDNAEEAESDAYTVRCSSCGQFAARTGHSCPQRVERERLEDETGVATMSIDDSARVNLDIELERQAADYADANYEFTEEPEEVVANTTEEEVVKSITEEEEEVDPEVALIEAEYSDPEALVDADADDSDDAIATPVAVEETAEEAEAEEAPAEDVEMLDDFNGLLTVNGPVQAYAEYVPTPQNQRHPEPLPVTETSRIERSYEMSTISVVPGSAAEHYFTSNYYNAIHLSDEDKEKIRNAPSEVHFVVGKPTTGATTAVLLEAYNRKHFNADIVQSYRDNRDENGNPVPRTSRVTFTREPNQPEIESSTMDEKAAIVESFKDEMRSKVLNDEAVIVPQNQTYNRKYKIDGDITTPFPIRFGRAADFRNAIKAGKIAVVNTTWEIPYGNGNADDQGYYVGNRHVTVRGDMAIKRNENGVMEVVSDQRTLRCQCRDYQRNYNCPHLSYIQRHAGNVAQQIMPAERSHRLLTSSLSARADVQVVEEKGSEPFIRFKATGLTRARNSWSADRYATVPVNMRPADLENPTVSEIVALQQMQRTLGWINEIHTPASMGQVRSSINRADVEMPFAAKFYESQGFMRGTSSKVSGTFRLHKGEDGEIEVTERSLKCTCADYAENYTCKHVTALEGQETMLLNVNTRNPEIHHGLDDYRRNNLDRWSEVTEIVDYMRIYDETEEEATARLARDRETAERERRERTERLRVENERYQEQNRIRMEEYERTLAAERAAVAAAQSQLAGEYDEYRQKRIKDWENVETPYSENPAEFQNAVGAALERKKKGESAVPFMTENVTDGICADGPGTRAFGVELEFDIKNGVNKSTALRKIGQELHAAGLTNTSSQTYYHAAAQNGYQKWSFEQDCTVDAELVSPIMKDTPEHWEELRKAVEIIERNGGVTSTRAGSHVHISSGSYQTKVAPHAELLRTFNQNEDIMYRMASDPKRGRHRGTRWCSPNTNDSESDISKDDNRSIGVLNQHGHGIGLNFESANNSNWKKANVEFRLWDSTLDVGVIQQQVAISAAMTDYADRKVEMEGNSKKPTGERKRIGDGRRNETRVMDAHGVTEHNETTFKESHTDVAKFFDTMFRTKKHRDAAASLFAVTNWQRN